MNQSQRLTPQPLLNINPLYSQYLLYTVFMLPDNYKGDQLQCENHGKGKSVLYIAQSYQLSVDVCVQSKQRILQTFHHLLTLQTTF